jgi:glycosyltransferase involved in cell wall biosynthesis
MSALPRITLVTPAYQQKPFIEDTLRSVIEQRYPHLEYLVLDGGSTDGTVDIVRRYEQDITYWCSQPDGGPYAAVESGFRRGTGEIFGWLNSSDLHFPWTLRTVGTLFAELPEVDWISSLHPAQADEAGACARLERHPGFSREAFLDGKYLGVLSDTPTVGQRGWLQQESTFWRRSLWERIGGTIGPCKFAGDFDLWARFYEDADLVGVDVPLALFRYHGEQRSSLHGYGQEAAASLVRARRTLGWSLPRARAAAFRARLPAIPKLSDVLAPRLGYSGRRAVHRGGRWALEEHRFF